MLQDESILCFAPDPWDDIWRNRHQIMSLLAARNRVLYVEPRPYLRSVWSDLRQRRLGWSDVTAPLVRPVNEGLHVFHPPVYAPLSGRPPLSTLTDALRHGLLRRAMRRLEMSAPILWLFRPDMADVPGHYGESLLIYHIVDEYTGYSDVGAERARQVEERERQLMARADLVLVTSRALWERKRSVNPHTYWVPNGVNYEAFAGAAALRREPPELADLAHPRVGYVGAINDKLDADLLLAVAGAIAPASLVLVGPERPASEAMRRGLQALHQRPNVSFVGQVPVERVPELMAACDVGLLPYRLNAWTEHIHPLKLYEYLACGLPVVAMDIPGVRDERALVRIADSAEAFVEETRQALREGSALRETRQQAAASNTWQQRVEQISGLIAGVRAVKAGA